MSSARCLNWSRPPPGRHPALRKQVSCSEPSTSAPSSTPSSLAAPLALHSVSSSCSSGRRSSLPGPEDQFCRQFLVTSAIIHTNRFQNYHTYDQARRGGSASLVRPRLVPDAPGPAAAGGGGAAGRADSGGRHRPASASAGQPPRQVLCKQLSLDRPSVLVRSPAVHGFASGMATVASGGAVVPVVGGEPSVVESVALLGGDTERSVWSGFNRKQQQRGAPGTKNEVDLVGSKKALKSGPGCGGSKDSRINIKIFLGQSVQQQDSSDTGVSDSEGTGPPVGGGGGSNGTFSTPKAGPVGSGPTPTNAPTEAAASSYTAGPPGGAAKFGKPATGITVPGSNGTATGAGSGVHVVGAASGNGTPGRSSSLAQRRAQFQANRQNSEAHDRRHPPLVRALSAPIRPADPDTSKFLQGKKKPRRRKVLREKDEYNICEEDEFSDDGDCKVGAGGASPFVGAAANATGKGGFPSGLQMRSRSVLGGACDIETLVSLLSSGGSDSEKEQEPAQASSPPGAVGNPSPTTFRQQPFPSSGHLPGKGRAPMLKKAGKSVSFQETDLKPAIATAGLNRDYRKPPSFQTTVANRMRRTQQLVSTLNAFQLKDKDRERGAERDESEENRHDRPTSASTHGKESASSSGGEHVPKSGGGKSESSKAAAVGAGSATAATGDLQTPKEQECYRLFLKMSKKGLAVSYDTILRGMLTPTELRVLQKKKNRENLQNSAGAGAEAESGVTGENGSPDDSGFSFASGDVPLPFGEVHDLRELNSDRTNCDTLELKDTTAETAPSDNKDSETEDEENTS